MFLEILMREDPLQGLCHCSHLERTRRSHGLPFRGLPGCSRASEWQAGGMGPSLLHKKSSFWHGRAVPEPSIPLLPQGDGHFVMEKCLIRHLHAKSSCPCAALQPVSPSAMGKTNLVSDSLQGIKRQSPWLLQEQGFWQNAKEPLIYGAKQVSNSSSQNSHHWSEYSG